MSGKIYKIFSNHWKTALMMLILIGLTALLFLPAVGYDYVKLDDDQYVASNPYVMNGLTADSLRWAFTSIHEYLWLPMLWISYMLDTELFGQGAFGHHLTNILLHVANAALLFWVLFRMTGSRWRSFFVAALFALHPLRVESVAWITARKDVLSGFFFFLAVMTYLRHVGRPSAGRFLWVAVFMVFGLMSKSILVILPFVLLLLDYWPLRRAGDPVGQDAWKEWKPLLAEKIPVFGVCIAFIVINLYTHRTVVNFYMDLSWLDRMSLIFSNYWDYLGLIFWPAHLSILYPEQDVGSWTISTLAAVAGLFSITILLIRFRKRAPFALIGWVWFVFTLFPMIRGVRPGYAAYADRFTYLPSIGLSIALIWTVAVFAENRTRFRLPLAGVGLLLLGACFARSAARLPSWENSLTMFSELIEFAPDHFAANNAYGFALMEDGRTEESLAYFARAAEIKPTDTQPAFNYADALLRLGRTDEAIAWLEATLAVRDPDCPALNNLLGFAYLDVDRPDLAIAPMRKAVQAHRRQFGWRIELVRALFEAGQNEAAQEEIRRLHAEGYTAIRGFEDLIPFYAKWWQGGEKRHAWNFFRNAIRNHPDHIILLNTTAWLLATDPDPPAEPREAVRLARRAAELLPAPHPAVLDTLAAALAADDQFEEAQKIAQQALVLAREENDISRYVEIEKRLNSYRQNQPWRIMQ